MGSTERQKLAGRPVSIEPAAVCTSESTAKSIVHLQAPGDVDDLPGTFQEDPAIFVPVARGV